MSGINNSVNRGIGKKPNDVKHGDFPINLPTSRSAKIKFKLGDHVRISAKKGHFDKGYEQGWTTEVYVVKKVIPGHPAVTYNLVDTNGEAIEGIFYTRELTKCTYRDDAVYRIKEILETRRWRGKRQHKVRWDGYGPEFDSWIDADSFIKL